MVTTLMNINSMSLCLRTSVLKLTSSLLLANCPDLKEGYEKKLLCQVFTSKRFYISDICQFARYLKQWFLFSDNVTPKLVSHVETQLSKSSLNSEEISEILFMLAEIVVEKLSFVEGYDESTLDEVTIFSFPKLAGRKGHAKMKILFNLDLALQEPLSGSAMENTWATLVCLPFVR